MQLLEGMATEVRPHEFAVEASTLGIAPGVPWPQTIAVHRGFGNGRALLYQRMKANDAGEIESVLYRQAFGCVELTVLND